MPFQPYFCGIWSYVVLKKGTEFIVMGSDWDSFTGEDPSFPNREILISLIELEFSWIFENRLQWSTGTRHDFFFPGVISLGHKGSLGLECHSSLSGGSKSFCLTSVSLLVRREVLQNPQNGVCVVLVLYFALYLFWQRVHYYNNRQNNSFKISTIWAYAKPVGLKENAFLP